MSRISMNIDIYMCVYLCKAQVNAHINMSAYIRKIYIRKDIYPQIYTYMCICVNVIRYISISNRYMSQSHFLFAEFQR
jgi:hypothetical protein